MKNKLVILVCVALVASIKAQVSQTQNPTWTYARPTLVADEAKMKILQPDD